MHKPELITRPHNDDPDLFVVELHEYGNVKFSDPIDDVVLHYGESASMVTYQIIDMVNRYASK